MDLKDLNQLSFTFDALLPRCSKACAAEMKIRLDLGYGTDQKLTTSPLSLVLYNTPCLENAGTQRNMRSAMGRPRRMRTKPRSPKSVCVVVGDRMLSRLRPQKAREERNRFRVSNFQI